jgi:hypothetical protein
MIAPSHTNRISLIDGFPIRIIARPRLTMGTIMSLVMRDRFLCPRAILTSALLWFAACGVAHGGDALDGYDLAHHDRIVTLPRALREISGLTIVDSVTVACIQDENGVIFLYDLARERIKARHRFHGNGDYEDLCRMHDTFHVLRSDGMLFRIRNLTSPDRGVDSFTIGIPVRNNEGLCYDADTRRLLIAGKSAVIPETKENKRIRVLYAFDPAAASARATPAMRLDRRVLEKRLSPDTGAAVGKTNGKRGRASRGRLKCGPSAIAVHPVEKRLYLLSAIDHAMFVLSMRGDVEQAVRLDPKRFPKAEGIAFFDNGDMLISNEAHGGKATILRYTYRAPTPLHGDAPNVR